MQYKYTAQQGSAPMPHILSGHALSALNNEIAPHPLFERRSDPINGAAWEKPRYFHVRLGELAYIQRAVKVDSHPALDDKTHSSLLTALYEAQEESARRVAQRLHDDSAQMLAVVYLELAKIRRECPDAIANEIGGVEKLLDGVRKKIRDLSHELHPPLLYHLGLNSALQFLAEGFSLRSEVTICIVGGVESPDSAIEIALYRIVQEALSNIVRHANASQAEVRLWTDSDRVHCTVTDNGTGFHVPGETIDTTHGLGLLGIYERVAALGGECDIVSCRRKGTHFTELQVELPL